MPGDKRLELIVFLGNPGTNYARTRHNAGWMVLDYPPFNDIPGWQSKFKASWTRFGAPSVILLKPLTMMNLSGDSTQAAMRFFKVSPESLLVVHDDVELGFGNLSVRLGGGLAGHNGLKSVANRIGTRDFWRLRLGVGRPAHGELRGHVLGRFSADEEARLPGVLREATDLLASQISGGVRPEDRRCAQ